MREFAGIERVVDNRDQLGETPLWCDRTEKLWWIDIEKPKIQSYHPASGMHKVYPQEASFVGSIALRENGGLIAALDNSLNYFDPETAKIEKFLQVQPEDGVTRLNDGRCDAAGRLWIGTMDNELFTRPLGSLYRIDPPNSSKSILSDIKVSNSMAFSLDGKKFYFSDTRRFILWVFDYDLAEGVLSNRKVFAEYQEPARPDGACVDADGCLWNAVYMGSRIIRYTPDGKIDRETELPVSLPTCVTFGGRDLDTLFITTATKTLTPEMLKREPLAGALLAIRPGVRGLPEARFAG